ncbi:MAG: FkbM family methyltransferase [Magnetococcales bacterium]|nr:FkbM family methyltransferase [Magnetococcales bacterium]
MSQINNQETINAVTKIFQKACRSDLSESDFHSVQARFLEAKRGDLADDLSRVWFNTRNRKSETSVSARSNWVSSLNWQIDFYKSSSKKVRVDSELDWAWFDRFDNDNNQNQLWLNRNADLIFDARELLEDDLSKLMFDSALVLRCSSPTQFYFPRINFDDFLSVVREEPFVSGELPDKYLGLPLFVFNLKVRSQHRMLSLNIINTRVGINLTNSYLQYFFKRDSIDLTPVTGDVVLDCGACIGEISLLMAGLVGTQGEVHSFDPVPIHARYCQLQASLNPTISHVLKINVLAVGDVSRDVAGLKRDSDSISPGGMAVDSFSMTSLDDYVSNRNLSRVNVIKMDIEGAEVAALEGASEVIKKFKPRLAISAYHKHQDFWEIPYKIKEKHSDYKLFFGHHSPVWWESVFYAV